MFVYVDESGRTELGGLYVVAAVAIRAVDLDTTREVTRSVPPTRRRLHWRQEASAERSRTIEVLLSQGPMDLWTFEAVNCPVGRQERVRRKALQLLAIEVSAAGGGELVIESRQDHNDHKDRQVLAATHRSHLAPETRYRHERPGDEPLLWLADALAGAVSGGLAGRPGDYLDRLLPHLGRHSIEV